MPTHEPTARRRRWLGTAVAVLLSAALAGCGSGNADSFVWGRTPSLTPDGRLLVFCQNLSTPSDRLTTTISVLDTGAIWRSAADGSAAKRLTPEGRGPDFYPLVSPDGRSIAFISAEDRQFDLWVEAIDGSQRRKLTYDKAIDTMPAWSPDSSRIVFVSDRGGSSDVWSIGVDGSGLQQITSNSTEEASPAYSPDGSKLIYVSNQDRGNFDLWLQDMQANKVVQLTRKEADRSRYSDGGPSWSPDGTRIAYSRWDGHWEIWTMAADGTQAKQLTASSEHSGDPRYSPDGRRIYYTSSRTGWWQVWSMAADGSDQRQVTGVN